MGQENKIGHGSLSQAKQRKSDRAPNMIGSITFSEDIAAGDKVYLSGWSKLGEDNKKWLSLSVERPQNKTRTAPAPVQAAIEEDDEIPF